MSSIAYHLNPFASPAWLYRARSARQAAMLSLLAIATEKQLPLAPMLDAFADDSPSRWRRQVRDLSDVLQSGASLSDALEAVPGLLPEEVVLAIRVGAESGTLAAALKLAAEQLSPKHVAAVSSPGGMALYLACLSIMTLVIISGIMTYIVPKFAKIFADFGTELPKLTMILIDASNSAATYGLLAIPLIVALCFLLVPFIEFFNVASHGPFPFWGPSKLLIRVMPRIASGGILRNLSIAVAAGRPLMGALSTMAGTHPLADIRRRIGTVTGDVEHGHDCWESLRSVGLIRRREATLLAAAERAGNLDWALRQVASGVDNRISFRFSAVFEFIRPLFLLLFGGVVGAIVIALFMPLIKLLNDLS